VRQQQLQYFPLGLDLLTRSQLHVLEQHFQHAQIRVIVIQQLTVVTWVLAVLFRVVLAKTQLMTLFGFKYRLTHA
jgi:hypothetical protein